jgi:hypothetical protein
MADGKHPSKDELDRRDLGGRPDPRACPLTFSAGGQDMDARQGGVASDDSSGVDRGSEPSTFDLSGTTPLTQLLD